MDKSKLKALMVTLASDSDVQNRSHGAIENADTVNYRTGKPKPKWLFCEAIFGPMKNFECSCGKYKGVRYKGIICERCGVEVTTNRVRRERMGHIDLVVPVVHPRYKSNPSGGLNVLLGLSAHELDRIINFVKYVVIQDPGEKSIDEGLQRLASQFADRMKELDDLYHSEKDSTKTKKQTEEIEKIYKENKESLEREHNRLKSIIAEFSVGSTILEADYRAIFLSMRDIFQFASGPEALEQLLRRIDVEQEIRRNIKEFPTIKSEEKRKKAFMLIKLLINLYVSGVKPENMIIRKLPVIPPDLRPVMQLDGGKFASSDVNLFYRRVLMRNIRLKKMVQVGMPDVVKKNEIRLLQESVNNLFVGEKSGTGATGAGNKVFKSLTDMLSGKEGVFRKNLLGKRVDYSGRSVITVGPDLKLNECGLPIYIATKMFTPHIIGKLLERKYAYTPKQAEKMIKDEAPIALKILEEVIKDKFVMLNRAPTLHRLSIEAFKIRLMPGKTIRIHPIVCPAFNADFDGDQMAVHLPISPEAQKEAANLVAADKNILKPGTGDPVITHSQDMVLGIYYLTDYFDPAHAEINTEEERRENYPTTGIFESSEKVLEFYRASRVSLRDKIILLDGDEHIVTNVGRVIFNSILPEDFDFINKTVGKKDLKKILSQVFDQCGLEMTVSTADKIKDTGFHYATVSGISINILDIHVPAEKEELLREGDRRAGKIYAHYFRGLFTEAEKHRLIRAVWMEIKSKIEKHVGEILTPKDNLHIITTSGARGSKTQTTQVVGMKWLVQNPKGDVIELPIKASFLEGLKPIEYFISAHSGRKGKADTALRTAESGYLTRKLADASQEIMVREHDCGTKRSLLLTPHEADIRGVSFGELIEGRVLARDVHDANGTTILRTGDLLTKQAVKIIEDTGIEAIHARSPITCDTISGVCQKCYGTDLSTRSMVDLGVPVGIIAAQSIGEPATQLTMNTFHGGGVVGQEWGEITQGLDRVTQLFEVRKPKNPAIVAPFDGTFSITEKGKLKYVTVRSDAIKETFPVKEDYKITVKKGETLKKNATYAKKGKSLLKISEGGEVLEVSSKYIVIGRHQEMSTLLGGLQLINDEERKVFKGEILTNGAVEIKEYLDIVEPVEAQKYMIREIKKVYNGMDLNDKHIELVVKQLFSKVFIEDAGESAFIPGTVVKFEEFQQINDNLVALGKKPANGKRLVLGLTQIAKGTDSRLSAASFQETVRVMVNASLQGQIDTLSDLKSNVIIGRLLPIGEMYRSELQKEDSL